ncbi:MAG: hypothetical protein J6Q76_05555 [Clostridia bacterium]|nr:hypothetical protein [Clostridia bacterium]
MFKAIISCLLFLFVIGIDVYICQDFDPKYLIMIIPMTLFVGAVAFTNIKAFVDDIAAQKHNKSIQDKNNLDE